jgi:hypothetical protein
MNKNRKLENSKIDGLTSDWLFKKPIDFEYKKYILLNYVKNSENRLNELKITAQNYEEQNLQNQINKIEAEIANIGPDLFTDPINYDFLKGKLSEVNKLIKRIEESRK